MASVNSRTRAFECHAQLIPSAQTVNDRDHSTTRPTTAIDDRLDIRPITIVQ